MIFLNWMTVFVAALMGLLIGSFLNVVIYRLPQMMYRSWLHDAGASLSGVSGEKSLWCLVFGYQRPEPERMTDTGNEIVQAVNELPRLDLMLPASRCQGCGHQIRWYENIPVISWLFLRGKCSGCGEAIAWRYPAIELLTGFLFAWCGWRWGLTWSGAAWSFFCAMLLVLAMIDWDTTLLPDVLTLPLVWCGLLASLLNLTQISLEDSVIGAAAGYLSLWCIYWLFKQATGKEGMGFGDFKLSAALGAWFGWTALVPIILIASCVGAVVGLVLKFSGRLHDGQYVPFGPFLVLGGFVLIVFGADHVMQLIGWSR